MDSGDTDVEARVAVLTTKVQVPPTRPRLVARARLAAPLDGVWQGRLLLVSAPAGFGKTTLLSAWAQRHPGRVAWLSLDPADNDPMRFWTYVVTALQQVRPGIGTGALALAQGPQPAPSAVVLPVLLNDLAALAGDVALVLDDYHLIEEPAIHQAVAYLIEHAPQRFHLVLAARVEPPLPLARLRARGHLAELRAADLCFDAEEAAAFLRDLMGLQLRGEHVAALATYTEGWAAGLQLAALALQARRGRPDQTTFLAAFGGSHRFVLDYLSEEVLARQPEPLQQFLLRTAVLDRLCGSLCEALTDRPDGAATLEALERANLFLVPLDEARRWYRYHHLFADVLRERLHRTEPNLAPRLYRRAAAWCDGAGLADEAVGYALAAGEFADAARLIERVARTMIQRGEVATLQSWLDRLPADLKRSRPRLGLALVWVALARGQLEIVEPQLQVVDAALAGGDDPETLALRAELAAVRVTLASVRQDLPGVIALAQDALAALPTDDNFLRGLVAFGLGNAHLWQGDLATARRWLEEAAALCRAAGNLPIALTALNTLALAFEAQGRLPDAAALHRQVVQAGAPNGRPLPLAAVAMAQIGLGGLHREWNELDAAADSLQLGIELARGWESTGALGGGYIGLARVLQARGDLDGAALRLEEAEAAFRRGHLPAGLVGVEAYRALLRLAQGDRAAAAAWAAPRREALDLSAEETAAVARAPPSDPMREFECLVLARIMLAQGEAAEAERLVLHLLRAAETANRPASVIKLLTVHALVLHARGDVRAALAALGRALAFAEPSGYIRLFVDEGPAMAALLRQALAHRLTPSYTARLLTAAAPEVDEGRTAQQDRASVAPRPPGSVVAPLIEPLTAREQEVLRLLAAGMSNAAIAQELVVVVGTVKRHVNSVYGKLGAGSRTQAVARARDLGLL